ncbi:MAG: sulfatase-like hydrolase/transferase [Pontixanthobacter sp.]
MAGPILFCGLAAILLSQRSSQGVRRLAIGMIFLTLLALYVTRSFNIDLVNVLSIKQYMFELNIKQSPEYALAGLLLLVSMGAGLYFGARVEKFRSRNQFVMAIAMVALIVNLDSFATAGTRGSYKASAPAGEAIDSAILQNEIRPETISANNLVVIIVESWGLPSAPFDQSIDRQVWNTSRLASRYSAKRGMSKYYGSTTNAEIREWCGAWADHLSFDFDKSNCLPEAFRSAGFSTMAFHSFNGDFFHRDEWYPKLGFEYREFEPELRKSEARFCDGVFAGVCDTDVPKILGNRLRASKSKRNLIYWLTVNAHLPVGPNELLGTDVCRLGNAQWRADFPMLCRSFEVHEAVANAIFEEIMREDFPEADILIVGDHMPPFFPRAIRSRFDAAHVPWIYLENKSAKARAAGKTKQS